MGSFSCLEDDVCSWFLNGRVRISISLVGLALGFKLHGCQGGLRRFDRDWNERREGYECLEPTNPVVLHSRYVVRCSVRPARGGRFFRLKVCGGRRLWPRAYL